MSNHTAASASFSDVRAAIDSAKPGDTVRVPAGKATWTHRLVIDKGINLIGAGIGKTVITNGYRSSSYNDGMILYQPSNPAANEPFRLSGFEFNGGGDGKYKEATSYDISQLLMISNGGTNPPYLTNIRIDNNYFHNCGKPNWISIVGHVCGVAHDNIIGDPAVDVLHGPRVHHSGCNNSTWANRNFEFGTATQFYWEDNVFNIGWPLVEGYYGTVYCFRYNTINHLLDRNYYPIFDMHGNKDATNQTSTLGAEVYGNSIVSTYQRNGALIDQRGGQAFVFSNSTNRTNAGGTYWTLQVREEVHDDYSPPVQSPDGLNQHPDRSYYWNNLNLAGDFAGVYVSAQLDYGGDKGLVPQEDRDFWQQKTLFNGTSGIGVGLLANRPASCTLEGAGYWATDEKRLYRWRSGKWEHYYTPYQYPHPLRRN